MNAVTVRDLTVRIPVGDRAVHAVTGVALTLEAGRMHALVGESGCGKSTVGAALCGMLPRSATVTGSVTLADGVELVGARERTLRRVRGARVALVPQSAATSFTPVRTVRSQLNELLRRHRCAHAVDDILALVDLEPSVAARYPHELSGGMAQRLAVGFALATEPDVIVADEPTSHLDGTRADHVLALLKSAADRGAAVLLVAHDLGRVRTYDDVTVMYAGRVVESGPAADVFDDPWHDWTRDLLRALPSGGLVAIPGSPPELTDGDDECPYHLRRPGTRFSGGPTHLVTVGTRTVRTRTDAS
ncbi:ABC transporter ATP-binding protein [Rhodococcus sp. HNM0569]|uniref:ABC transporter ATP-binding protein n=1 Tax=Rhodococcus sp. HNM0569 TaxID=2716340 RepID=UPI00146A183E|nr:ABC transporter ATP-binding protein [Rhodococcus sp. HNM0569]NLU85091.1 ABC transporter ATP-binding protein [Rhodococcus sp. HNM0569]